MNICRLDSIAQCAAERFRHATYSKRREAVRIACEYAVAAVGLSAPDVNRAVAILNGVADLDSGLRGRLEVLAAEYDDRYFQLNEDDNENQKQEALRCFSMARAVSALAFAVSSCESQLHEAIYECVSAVDEPGELLRLVERALE